MFATLKRSLPWVHGLLAYLVWKGVGLIAPRRISPKGPVEGPVCVIQMNALGDVLMVTPLLRSLVNALGPGRVEVVVQEHAVPLLETFVGLGQMIPIKGHLHWRSPSSMWAFCWLARELRQRRYRAVLDASRLMQSAWLTYLSRPEKGVGLRARRRLGPFSVESLAYLYTHEVDPGPEVHMLRQTLAMLRPLGLVPTSEATEFAPSAQDCLTARRWLEAHVMAPGQRFVVLHPGGKWPPKRWPKDRFRTLAARLQESGVAVVVIGDKRETSLIRLVTDGLTPTPLVCNGDLGLGALGALMQRASLFVGNDSGPMHLAAAVGTPVVGLFGPTFPERCGPLGATSRSFMKPIDCRPCRLYFTREHCERGHNYCMDLIGIEEVWAAVRSILTVAAPTIRDA
jgi:ADP-heptose:LPS heptosyltransferase